MEQNLTINIGKPCTEKFENFKTTKSGGFCGSCKKEVIDFRKMSDKALIQYFKNQEGKTCGYFNESQLKTYEVEDTIHIKKNYTLFKTIGFAFFSMLSLQHIQAQNKQQAIEVVENTKQGKVDVRAVANHQKQVFTGVVTDDSGPLPGANIVLKGTGIGTSTNFDGEFEFPRKLYKGDVLVVSYLGYKTQEIKIKDKQMFLKLNMPVELSCVLVGEVDVNQVYKSKKGLWHKIKSIF